MRYIEAPSEYKFQDLRNSVFLAGGITDCPDWQQEMVKMFANDDITILNPRRQNFPIEDPKAAMKQITWEHFALRASEMISFWFPCETICPIILYELGAWSMVSEKPIFVGVHPDYQRRVDVEIQTKLIQPNVEIVYSLEELYHQILQ